MTLLELAERCEKATGPDRKLDAEIDIAVRGFPQRAYEQANGMRGRGSPDLDPIEWFIKWGAALYTASLDAAMTLVPEGWDSACVGNTDDGRGYASLAHNDWHMMVQDPDEFYVEADAATRALALCAAALRARGETL